MKKLPDIIYLVRDHEDPDYIVWQSHQPANSKDGIAYIRCDIDLDTLHPDVKKLITE